MEKEISNEIHGSNPPADPSFANNPISGLQTSPAFENLDVITKSDKVIQAAIVPDMMSMLGTASPSKVGPAVIATDASKIAQPFSKPAACTIPENLSVFDPSIKSSKIVKASAHTTKEAILYDKQKKNEFRSFVKELEKLVICYFPKSKCIFILISIIYFYPALEPSKKFHIRHKVYQ